MRPWSIGFATGVVAEIVERDLAVLPAWQRFLIWMTICSLSMLLAERAERRSHKP